MNRVWEMFFTFSKFMTYLLTENASEQYYNLPNHVKDAVYQLLTATIYFLQKIQYKIDKNTDNTFVDSLVEQLLSSELKPVDRQQSTLSPDAVLSGELKNEIKDSTQIFHQDESLKCIEVRDELSELGRNKQKTGFEQSVDFKNENEAIGTVNYPNEDADLKVSDTRKKFPDDRETEILPEVYSKIQELILTTNELIDYLNKRLSREKIKNFKNTSRFNEIMSCQNSQAFEKNKTLPTLQKENQESNQDLLMQDSKENIIKILKQFSEDFQLNRDFSKIKKKKLVHSSYLSVSSEQLKAIDLRKPFNNVMNKDKSESVLGICSTEQNASKKEDLESGLVVTSTLQGEAISENKMEALNENSTNGKKEETLKGNFNGKKNGSKLFTENKRKSERSTDFIELEQTYNMSAVLTHGGTIQDTKTVSGPVFSQLYKNFVKDVAKNRFRGRAYYCEPCKQIFTHNKKWKTHYNERSQHFRNISLLNSRVVLEKCDICKFAVIATNLVANQHLLLHMDTHDEVSASDINSRQVESVNSKTGISKELYLKAGADNGSENVFKNKMIKVEDLEKSFEECESYKENDSEEDGVSVDSRSSDNAEKYSNLRGTDPQYTNEFRSIFCKKNFKILNRILSRDRNSDAFYCEPCDIVFISKSKWNVHCSNFHFHQEAMNKQDSEYYEIRCKYCNLFVTLPYNLIELYMRSHLRIHKLKNEEYKIINSKSLQKHYIILNEFRDKLIQYCKDRKRKYFIKENVKTNNIIGQILVNPNNKQPSEGEQNSKDIKKVQEKEFAEQLKILKRNHSPDVISRVETGNHELVVEKIPDVITKVETEKSTLSGENENLTLYSSQIPKGVLSCSPEVLLYVRTALSERTKKVSTGLPLFLGLCLFCEKSCKTPLEWSYHLRNYRQSVHAMNGVGVSCFKCALIIYGNPSEHNLHELLLMTEHLCCQEIVKE